MRLTRLVAPLVFVAAVALVSGSVRAEATSPYLGPIVLRLERFREEHGAELDPKALARLDGLVEALSAQIGGFDTHLKALQKAARLARRLPPNVAGSAAGFFDIFVGDEFAAEIQANLDAARTALPAAPGKNVERLRRKAARLLDLCQTALDAARSSPSLLARAAQLVQAHARLEAAVEVLGKIDRPVVLTWTQCDSFGYVGTPYVRGVNGRVVLVDGYPRRFLVYVPQTALYQPGVRGPVVVMHHGSSGTDGQFLLHSGWREKAEATGLVAVFPQGLVYRVLEDGADSTKWNHFELASDVDLTIKPAGYPSDPLLWPARDVVFEGKILDDLDTQAISDPNRVYASGFSIGGVFTMRLAVELSDRIKAAGAVLGGLATPRALVGPPIPVAVLEGTLDDRRLGAVNASLAPEDQYAELPLDPATILTIPQLAIPLGVNMLATFQLRQDPHAEVAEATSTKFQFATPRPGNTAGNVYELTFLAGLTHHWPHYPSYPGPGGRDPVNNPNDFSAPDIFWSFFEGP